MAEDDVRHLTPGDVCDRFRIEPDTLREWVKTGKLRAIQINQKTRRFRIEDVEEFEREHLTELVP